MVQIELLALAVLISRVVICLTKELDPLLKSREMKIAITVWPPVTLNCSEFPTFVPSRQCPYPGFDAENMGMILTSMGVKNYSFYIFDGRLTTSGDFVNGSWTNILGMVDNGTMDTICGSYTKTKIREEYFDFSYPLLQSKPVFVVKKRTTGFIDASLAIFRSFDAQVWLLIFFYFLAQVIYFYCVDKVQINGEQTEHVGIWTPGTMCFNMFRMFIGQATDLEHRTFTGNFLIVAFGFTDLLLVNIYQGLLVTELLHPSDVKPFSNTDDMIRRIGNKEFSLLSYYTGNWYFQYLNTSVGDHYVKMRAALSSNPLVVVENQTQVLEMVAAGHYILPLDSDGERRVAGMCREGDSRWNHYCDLTYIDEGMPSEYRHYLFKKGSLWTNPFNEASIEQQSFSMNAWEKYFGMKASVRDPNEVQVECPEDPPDVRALPVGSLTGLFCLFVSGVPIAFAICAIEYIFFQFNISDSETRI